MLEIGEASSLSPSRPASRATCWRRSPPAPGRGRCHRPRRNGQCPGALGTLRIRSLEHDLVGTRQAGRRRVRLRSACAPSLQPGRPHQLQHRPRPGRHHSDHDHGDRDRARRHPRGERGTMENLLAMPVTPLEVMIGKLLPFIGVGLVQVAVIVGAALLLFGVPMLGSPGPPPASWSSSPPTSPWVSCSARWRRISCRRCRCRSSSSCPRS